jgi:SAM dependent carboxyl methyltransferase
LDIGSAEGRNATYAMNRLTNKLRCVSELPICVLFNDLPTNDFNRLFANLFPDGTAALSDANIFPGAIGGTAFDSLVPPRSLHIATTFNAIGFLETKPNTRLPHYILPMGPGPLASRDGVIVTESERAPFRLQAENDLYQFYTARAEELVNGGKLLVQIFGRDDNFSTNYGIYDVLSDAILDYVEKGILPRKVYEELIFPIYFRTVDELITPIEKDERLARAFRVEKAESREVSAPFNVTLAETGDQTIWARSYTGFLRAFTEAILASALPIDLRQPDTLDNIYQQVEKRLVADPARYEFHYISVGALLTRV